MPSFFTNMPRFRQVKKFKILNCTPDFLEKIRSVLTNF